MGRENDFPSRLPEINAVLQKYIDFKGIDPENTTVSTLKKQIEHDSKVFPSYIEDIKFWRLSMEIVGSAILICIISSAILAYLKIPIPEILVTSASTLIGVIAGLFAGSIQNKN
jgi:hypothetical protein